MTRIASTLGVALLVASLSGCAAVPPADKPPVDTPSGTCNASMLSWTTGQTADEALVARAKQESGAKQVRIVRPGMMVTMEYSDSRLNLYIDTQQKVLRYSCG